jgi:GWT1
MLVTCLAILAVDFRIFPRRFAKTETFGISLMDIGVGTFIVSSAVTSRYARGQYPPRLTKGSDIKNGDNDNGNNGNGNEKNENENNNNEKKSKNNFSFSELYRIIQLFFYLQTQNWKHYLVLILGLGRMIALKVFNYHENVSEYGVHWNFFVTLFSIWQISDFLHRFLSRKFLPWFAITVLLLYQFTLSKTTMTDFIFAASRKNFFYANREGFLSLFGYVPMYLLVEMLAHHFFYNCENDNDNDNNNENENVNEVNYENENEDSINMNIKTNYNNNNSNDNKSNYDYMNSSSSSKESNNNNNEESETSNDEIGSDENDFNTYNIRNSPSIGENRPGSNIGKNDSGKFRKTDFSLSDKPKKNSNFFSFRTTDSTHSDKERDKDCSSTLFLSPHSPNNNNNNNSNNQNNLNYRKNVLHYPYFKDKIGNKSQRHFYRQLSVIIAVLWTAWLASTSVQQTSRRLANLAYVSLVLALSFTLILLIAVADSMGDLVLSYKGSQLNTINNINNINNNNNNNHNENKNINVNDNTTIDEINTKSLKIALPQHPAIPLTIRTLECLNEFQLPVFLVSNVMTGVINMTIKTIYSSHIVAFFILSIYAMTFIGFAWIVSDKLNKK